MAQSELAFGRFRLQPGRQLLLDGKPVSLGTKPLNILSTLVAANGNLVTKDELIATAWPGLVVEENALQAHISALRRTLGEDGGRIVTVPGHGYRFEAIQTQTATNSDLLSEDADAPLVPPTAAPAGDPVLSGRVSRPWMVRSLAILIALGVSFGVWNSLKAPRAPTIRPDRFLIMPFTNRTGDPRDDDLVATLGDAVGGKIASQIWESEVVSPVPLTKGGSTDPRQLAQSLSIDFLIEGSLLPTTGDREITATVVDARTGNQIASVSAKAPRSEPERERLWLTAALVDRIHWSLIPEIRRRVAQDPDDERNVRSLVVRAETLEDQEYLGETIEEAKRLIGRALEIAPHNVHALTSFASLRIQSVNGFDYRDAAGRNAELTEAERALEEAAHLEPNRPAVRLSLGDLRSAQGRHDAAKAEFQRVLDLDPLNAYALDGLAAEDIYAGAPEAALEKLSQAERVGANDAYLVAGDIALAYMMMHREEEALAQLRKAAAIDSSDPWIWIYLAAVLQITGRPDEAKAAVTTLKRLNPAVTIDKLKLADMGASPRYLAVQERIYAGLSEAGLN